MPLLDGRATLTHRIVADLVDNLATGVIHGSAGTGKTFAVESALEDLINVLAATVPSGCPAPSTARATTPSRALSMATRTEMVAAPVRGAVLTSTVAFTSKPTMRLVAEELVKAITRAVPRNRSRFYLTAMLVELLTGAPRLLVIDEARRLNGDCIELIRASGRRWEPQQPRAARRVAFFAAAALQGAVYDTLA